MNASIMMVIVCLLYDMMVVFNIREMSNLKLGMAAGLALFTIQLLLILIAQLLRDIRDKKRGV